MARFKVVYVDGNRQAGVDWSVEREILATADAELVVGACATDDEVAELAADADGILNTMYFMNRALFERLPNVKVVVRGGVGYDNLDVEGATDCGIVVCNVTDYGYNEVANHAFAMLIALNRKLVQLDRAVRDGTRRPPPEVLAHTGRMAGETLGLVAFGNIAQAVARRAKGFDLRVIAYDPYVEEAKAKAMDVELVPLEELMRRSDYISVHTPLFEETRGLIGERELALMKPSAYIVITSRGGVIDEAALVKALAAKQIAGAGIDVWVNEPVLEDNPLLQFDNVLASQHNAWYSDVSPGVLRRRVAEAAADVLRGVMPRSVVNPKVLQQVSLAPRPAES
ncbi:MAG TPA: C-terminal binding protein [Acidimicrobiales bacterium]|nr:C-terminal binding protein [Acidimicrobiales bacterium]